MFSGAKVLVAGGVGFVGANLINRLLSLGATVRATVHRKDPVILDKRIEYVRCDLTKMEDCQKVVSGMDCIHVCGQHFRGSRHRFNTARPCHPQYCDEFADAGGSLFCQGQEICLA